MPWKFCPRCKQVSYSAATNYKTWICPYCGNELKDQPDYNIDQVQDLLKQGSLKPHNDHDDK